MEPRGPGKDNTPGQGLVLELEQGLVPGLACDGLQVPDGKDSNTAAQADTDRVNNRGLGTASCKPRLN